MSSVAKSAGKTMKRLPNLNEMGFTLARILVTLVAVAVALISFLSGGDLIAIALRTGIAILVVGLITWLVNWLLVSGVIESLKDEVDAVKPEKPAADAAAAHTIEKSA